MNLLMALNSKYCFPSLVTIHSLMKHNPVPVTVYVLYSALTEEEKAELNRVVTRNGQGTLVLLPVDEHAFEGLKLMSWISKETFYRLLAQKLLPETVDRFLWLDSDVLVLQNLQEFYDQDMEGQLLVATSTVAEGAIHKHYLQLTLPADTRYFNAGVLLYDLKAQRERLDANIYEEYIKHFSKQLKLADQDVLNAVFYRLVKYADQKTYNGYVRQLNDLTAKERRERLSQTAILHYNGNSKPWEETYSQLCADLFWSYAKEVTDCDGQYEAMKQSQRNARRRYLRAEKKKQEKERARAEKAKAEQEEKARAEQAEKAETEQAKKAGNNSGTV